MFVIRQTYFWVKLQVVYVSYKCPSFLYELIVYLPLQFVACFGAVQNYTNITLARKVSEIRFRAAQNCNLLHAAHCGNSPMYPWGSPDSTEHSQIICSVAGSTPCIKQSSYHTSLEGVPHAAAKIISILRRAHNNNAKNYFHCILYCLRV